VSGPEHLEQQVRTFRASHLNPVAVALQDAGGENSGRNPEILSITGIFRKTREYAKVLTNQGLAVLVKYSVPRKVVGLPGFGPVGERRGVAA
jgi:hypothetical protein